MAKGAHEIRNLLKQNVNSFADHDDLQKRLDEFYMSRIGIRMLIGQYLALRDESTEADMIGLINLKASPYKIALQAIQDASYICNRTHGDAPEVQIFGRTDLHFPCVPSHISYIMLELLKNSMRATIETHGLDKMPPIRIIIADGEDNEDVVIKVSDEGGGIRRSNIPRVWSYLYTTADPSVLERMISVDGEDVKDFGISSPLAGLGYGLPIARNYARCFEGDLNLMSMEGYGTDSFIYLPRLGSKDTAV
jgi:pyruvate dehydrogenase kinase 2/3/4